MEKVKNNFMSTKKERITYGLFFFGQNILWGYVGYISTFMTDLGISAALASIVILVPKIWDAVNDALFGYVVDKINPRRGKFMPWVRIGVTTIALTTIFMFFAPKGMSETLKCVWLVAGYVLFDACYTFLDAPAFAMPNAMTTNIHERTSIISNGKLWGMVGALVAGVAISLVQKAVGWGVGAIIFSLLGVGCMLPFAFIGKERVQVQSENEESYSMKAMFSYLKKNNLLFVVLLSLFICGITGVEGIMGLYVARVCFGDQNMAAIISLVCCVPVVIVSALIPTVTKKVDKFKVLVAGLIFGFVSNLLAFFVGYSSKVLGIAVIALKCCGMAFYQIILYMLIADTVEFGKYRSGVSAAGITFSLQTFIAKLKGALINSMLLAVLAAIGFVSGEGVTQTDEVAKGIWGLFTLLPVAGYLISTLLLVFFYKLRDGEVQTIAKYNNHEITVDQLPEIIIKKYGKPAVIAEAPVE